ncbi:hypothetical protein FOA43_001575 [Brettanomyces nanus]|uniref:Protein transport protein BOS1 n=1 Tax=Eeniella nana TaxID=13502 RepID=A0A875RNX2_EENNA|nr:uncharacterized protein FOA43_001575 [Brettanomyces nanus]QPG74250.1 hypothetical protein FOA43_001575 [Brettanomyces nanus]
MSLLYNNASRLTQQVRRDLEQFEKNPVTAAPALLGQITTTINNLGRTLADYEMYIKNQTLSLNESQKVKNQNRLENLQKEYSEYKVQFSGLRKQREEAQAEQNKSQLFSNRSTAISDNPYEENGITSRQTRAAKENNEISDSGMTMRDGLYKEQSTFERSNQQLDDILEMGRQAFDDLVEQNEIVGKMRDKMNSSLETMGVSRATIRQIEKIAFEDKWIFYIGAALTLFIMYMIYHYLG